MSDTERGRLFSIRMDGSDSVPFVIKKDKLLFGRSDSCEIRIYVDGVEPEHCIVTFNTEGRGFLEPVNKAELIFLNGKKIERQVSLEHNDVITVVKRSFRFFYPVSSLYFESCLSVASSDKAKVDEHLDFNMDMCKKKDKEVCEKHVTFGPSLSPEEFDKNLPPASPLRRGSLPSGKCQTKIPCRVSLPGERYQSTLADERNKTNTSGSEARKPDMKRNLFNTVLSTKKILSSDAEQTSSENKLPKFSFNELKSVNRVESNQQPAKAIENVKQSKPLFSDVLKSHISKAEASLPVRKLQKSSPKLLKKSVELQPTKRPVYGIPKKPVNPRMLAVGSTGHANSPETIVICKRREKFAPTLTSRKISDVQQKHIKEIPKQPVHPQNEDVTSNSPALEKDNESEEHDYSEEGTAIQDSDSEECVEMSNSKSNENLTECENLSTSDEKFKKISCEGANICVNKRAEEEVQTTTSPLAAAMNNFHSDNYTISNSLNNFPNTTETSSCLSNLPFNLSKESSTSNCMNTVQNLALTISMINAYHMYNRIMDDISSFPLCFPSTSFETFKDTKSIQKSGSQQNGDQGDNSRLIRFQDIMQNFFSSNDFKDDKDIQRSPSCGKNLNDTSSSACNRMKEAKFAYETQVHFKANDFISQASERENDHSQHDIDLWIDQINKTDEIELENVTNNCSECNMAVNLCTCLQNSYNTSVENNVEMNFSKTSSMQSNKEYPSYNSPEENVYFSELPYICDATQQNTSQNSGNKTKNISFEKNDSDSKSMKDVASKRKSVNLNKRSVRTRLLRQKRSISSAEISKESLATSQAVKSFKNLRSRNSLILKTKRRKVSLVQMYGFNASKKAKTINTKKLNVNLPEETASTTKYLKEYNANVKKDEGNKKVTRQKRNLKTPTDTLDEDSKVECTEISSKIPYGSKRRLLKKRGKGVKHYTDQECIPIEEINIEVEEQAKNKRKRKLRSDTPEIECTGIFSETSCSSKKRRKNTTDNNNEQKKVSFKGTKCEGKKIIKRKQNLKKTDTSDVFQKNSEVECKEILAEISSNSKKRRRGNATDIFNECKESSVQETKCEGKKRIKRKQNLKKTDTSDVFQKNSEVECKEILAEISSNSKKRRRGNATDIFNECKESSVQGIEYVENKEIKRKRNVKSKNISNKSDALTSSEVENKDISAKIPCNSVKRKRGKNTTSVNDEQKDISVKGIESVENKEIKSKRTRSVKKTIDKSKSLKISEAECKDIFSEIPRGSKRERRKKNATDGIKEQKDILVKGTEIEENEIVKNKKNRNLKNAGDGLDHKISQFECKEIFTEIPCDSKRGRRKKAANANEHKDASVEETTCEENEGIKKKRNRKVKTTNEDSEALQEMEIQGSPKRGRRKRNDTVKGVSLKEKKPLAPKNKRKKQTESLSAQSIESPVQPKKRNRIR